MADIKIKDNDVTPHSSIRTVWSKSMPFTLFFVTMLLFVPLIYHFSIALQPPNKAAKNGEIHISQSDFSQRNTLALAGDWKFFWGQLHEPNAIPAKFKSASTMSAKGGWQSAGNIQNYDAIGFATYYLTVNLEQESTNLALHIPPIESAYKLYIDEHVVASAGKVTNDRTLSQAGYHNTIVHIPDGLKRFTLTIQISNYHSSWGGIWQPLVLGDIDSLHTMHRDKVALSMFIFGVLLITAIHSLIQFFLRPTNYIPLVFACLCLLLFLREFTVEHMSFALSEFVGGFVLITKLNFFSFYAGIPIALHFFHLCHPKQFHSKVCIPIYYICVAFAAFILLSPTRYIGISVEIFQLIALAVMLYILFGTWRAMRKHRKGASVMLLGSIIAFAFAINDLLNMNGLINTGRFFSLGILGFIACQSIVTNSRFDKFIDKNALLTETLKERNSDLEIMSKLLETKVEQRTQQLKKVNKELALLANNDPLTGVFNRHGIQPYIQTAFERYHQSQSPFSIILIDYDHFKQVNDTYGHDVGDLVLITGVDLIKKDIRDQQDKLARWGGEEFLILLPNTTLSGAISFGEKLRTSISAEPIGQPIGISVSITGGVAQVEPNDTFDSLFKRADDALYRGKRQGRNRIFS